MPPDDEGIPAGGGQPDQPIHGLTDPRAPWEELIEDPAAPRRLLAVFFTDIVGSTELATALGDTQWRELLEQHDAVIRSQLARFGGREIDTAGDAFFATFELPIRAVDCALESIRAVRRLGLRIRAGVHMGECVVSNENVRGVSVHIGARVAAKAGGGQVLVSSTVRDVLAGAGLRFQDRGEQTLKGVEGRWRLYEVEARERDDESDLPPLLEAELKKPALPWWRRRQVVIAGVTSLAVLIAAVTFILRGSGGLRSVDADSVAVIDASSLTVTSATKVGARPVGLVSMSSGVWVTNSFDRSVSFVSSERSSVDTIRGLGANPLSVAISPQPNLVWIADADGKAILRVSPETGQEVGSRILGGNGLTDIVYGAGAIWVTNSVDGTVWRIEPTTGLRTHSINVGPALRGIAVGEGAVWATSEIGQTLSKIDAGSASVVSVTPVGRGPRAVAVGAGAVWVANGFDATVSRVDPATGRVAATIPVGDGPRAVAVASGKVFVANEADGTVSVIDAGSNKVVRAITLHSSPMGLTARGNRVWVSVRGGTERYRGGTLRFGTAISGTSQPGDGFPALSFDPPFGFPQFSYAMEPALFDGLVAFKQVGGVEGAEVVPDLAEDIRPPTDNGLTQSFTLRPGLKYSDGTAVEASDMRASIERIFRIAPDGTVYNTLFRIIKGTEKCTAERCDLSEGIVTNDTARTIVFHLRTPLSDFPYILALPGASLVPASTPMRGMHLGPLPGTGPYRIASTKGDPYKGGEAVLERNQYFKPRGQAQPGGYADRIIVSWGGTPESHVEAVRAGREDWTIDTQEPGIPIQHLATQVPAQLHVFDIPALFYAVLNSKVPPFNDVKVRRALNLAVDRRAIQVAAFGGGIGASPTCQVLAKNMIGYRPLCPYTTAPGILSGQWSGPDIAAAKRLVAESGTRGTHVTIWVPGFRSLWRPKTAEVLASTLRELGYKAEVRSFEGDILQALFTGKPALQVTLQGWVTDYPSAASYFVPLLACPRLIEKVLGSADQSFNLSGFCDRGVDGLMDRALSVQREDVAQAGGLWAEVDRAVAGLAPWVPLVTGRVPVLVSKRIGNVLMNPALGPLLSQMWVVEGPKPTPT
jgi:YVTN family beta-propeller protein